MPEARRRQAAILLRMRNRSAVLTVRLAACIALALSLSCAQAASTVPSNEPTSEYNQGVDAFRAKDYDAARRHWQLATQAPDAPPEVYNNLGFPLHQDDVEVAIRQHIYRFLDELAIRLPPEQRAAGARLGEDLVARYSKPHAE